MAKQTINIGAAPNDGTGNNLRVGGLIINDNFNEIYTAIGDGSNITFTSSSSIALTNKTISGSNNTLLNIGNSSLTNSSFSIRDDSSSVISIALGGTLKIKSNDGITTTVSQGDTVTISLDSNVLTETSTDVLTNKSIAASSNTISGLTNTNLSGTAGITNANIANSFITISDESSTQGTIPLGGRIEFTAGEAINTTIENGNRVLIAAEDATSSNKGVATFNTASFTVTSGDVTIKSAGVSNAQLANSTITLGSTSTALGATTSSVAGLSLTGSTNTIDLTSSGNKLRFNFANTGVFPNATTYQGLFAVATGAAKAYFADSGAYNEILSENSSIKDLSDVAGTNPSNGQILIFNSTSGRYEPGANAVGTVTSVATGTGLTGGPITSTGTILVDTSSIFQGAATIDVTASGSSAYLFNSHYSGNNPTLYLRAGHTYAFNLQQGGSHPFFLQTVSGSYSAGNAYATGLTHVTTAGTVTTGAVGAQSSGVLYIEVPSDSSSTIYYVCQNHSSMAGKIILGNITETATGDGSTVTLTINSGRNVNDLLVFVNGLCLRPTTDYTISGTTLTFLIPPALAAAIIVRYL